MKTKLLKKIRARFKWEYDRWKEAWVVYDRYGTRPEIFDKRHFKLISHCNYRTLISLELMRKMGMYRAIEENQHKYFKRMNKTFAAKHFK